VAWTIEDLPLLDEAAEQLGSWTEEADRTAARTRSAARRREVDYARSVLSAMDLGIDIDAEQFADRFAEHTGTTVAEQAARDRSWKFGHVIVDEAQELSPMLWRMVFRRNPIRSMTVVGDLAQCSASWAPSSWREVIDPYARGSWRLVELSTNYRTPTEIMDVANAVLRSSIPDARPTTAIRSSGHRPLRERVGPGSVGVAAAEAVAMLLDEIVDGRLGIIAPTRLLALLADELTVRLGSDFDPSNPLGAKAALLSVAEVKGLEFDAVVLVEPGEIARRGPRGPNDLYVALTRATQRLFVVHEGPLPPEIEAHVVPFGGR
jgi:DNA helicase IV